MSLADRARTRGTPGWGRIARGGSRRDRVRSEVEQLIIYGVLAPGEHLREEGWPSGCGSWRQHQDVYETYGPAG